MEVNSEQSLWIILSITHLAPVLISSMVLWLMQATRRWVGGGGTGRRRGGSGGAAAPPLGQCGQSGAAPGGAQGLGWRGGTQRDGGAPRRGKTGGWGGETQVPTPFPGRAELADGFPGSGAGFHPGELWPPVQSLWESGDGAAGRGGARGGRGRGHDPKGLVLPGEGHRSHLYGARRRGRSAAALPGPSSAIS